MSKYKIKYTYQTGDSFSTSEGEDYLELSWDNLDMAKRNLKAIEDHYKMYEELQGVGNWGNGDTHESILKRYEKEWWFVGDRKFAVMRKNGGLNYVIEESRFDPENPLHQRVYDRMTAENCMYLMGDGGQKIRQWNPWCGYFETLYGAEIATTESGDMSFDLR